ncbi:MAG: TIR domain-containing protein [Ruminococcus sp.]|nr:TIR domain-containing protein [Ruminococcus sp.]
MARRVFFSFHYDNDINRSMTVRNSWVTQGKEAAGFVDKADFEQIKRTGTTAVHNWIDKQLNGTSVTVVLIGSETLNRPFVQYEICESLKRGNGVIGVYIHNIKDMITQKCSIKGNPHTVIGHYPDGSPAYFDNVCDGLYDYTYDDGYANLGTWIENAAKAHNK